jgi:hypothetical protein
MNFLTVSGMAAQRVSPAASFRTATFIRLFQDEKDEQADHQADKRAIFHHPRETVVIVHMGRHLGASGVGKHRFFFLGHEQIPL